MKKHLLLNKKSQVAVITLVIAISMGSLFPQKLYAQSAKTDSTKSQAPIQPAAISPKTYPRAIGYLSFILPVVTVNKDATTYNFNGTTSIGFPIGVNVLYSDNFGFSYEFTPTIKSTNSTSRVSNILFDPGTMFRFKHGFTFISRLAFETSGRYGFTPVFNQIYARSKFISYFVAGSLPARFGNGDPASIGLNIQFGFIFN